MDPGGSIWGLLVDPLGNSWVIPVVDLVSSKSWWILVLDPFLSQWWILMNPGGSM